MGKSTSFNDTKSESTICNDTMKSEFSKMEQVMKQTANDVSRCLRSLKSNFGEYDTRHGLYFLNTSKSFMRSSIRDAKDMAEELYHVADEIAKSDMHSESEITAARSKIRSVSDALTDLKKKARSYDHKNSLNDGSQSSSVSESSLSCAKTESEESCFGDYKDKTGMHNENDAVKSAETAEAVVRLTLRDSFSGFSAVKHQIALAEQSLSPSFADRVMETVTSMTNNLKLEEASSSFAERVLETVNSMTNSLKSATSTGPEDEHKTRMSI